MLRRFVQFCVPSLLGTCAAGLLASLAETAVHTRRPMETLAGAGFLLLFAVPLGALLSIVGRGLFRLWNFSELLRTITDERGASPRFCAWLLFVLIATSVLWGGMFQGMRMLFAATRVKSLVALGAVLVVGAIVLVLAGVSRPAVSCLEHWLIGVEARRTAKSKSAIAKPLYVVLVALAGTFVTLSVSWWIFILPSIRHLEFGFASYLLLFAVGVAVFPLLWRYLTARRLACVAVAGIVVATTILCILSSQWTRYQRPYGMLELWGETKLAGWAIDTLYDVQSLRDDLQLDGIKPTAISDDEHPNVVVITISSVRADRVPVYGGPAKMPRLQALSSKSAVFERAYSSGNVARRSLPSIATGLSPRRVRGRVVGGALRLDLRHVLLAERFRAGGYDTAGFFCCQGHFGRDGKMGLIRGIEHLEVEERASNLAKKTAEWLEQRRRGGKPLFLWTHYVEPENWARNHIPDTTRGKKDTRYNLSLADADAALDILLESVINTLGEKTIIVVTSDHGEGLGDHGIKHHGASLYNSEIRVPMLIAGPGISAGRKQQVVGLADLAPTLMELAGFEAPGMPHMDGQSVAPVLRGEADDVLGVGEAYSQMISDRSVHQSQAAVISGRFKLISREGGRYELFDMSRDPREAKDIKEKAPKLFESMKARLKRREALDQVPPF
ncbi:MAG: sulfatase-like hydrolase/transferase [Myxococcales bacterium]|nr:sulfatase-like hydrolase/transferase [Myxococcales bacterium]